MTSLLPALRWLLGLWTPDTAPTTALSPSLAPEPPTETTPPPQWRHGPTEPREPAEKCGEPGCDNPVGSHESGEFCGNVCAAAWAGGLTYTAKYLNEEPFHAPDVSPEPPAEPAWMARLTAWERAKAARLVAERKSPGTEKAA